MSAMMPWSDVVMVGRGISGLGVSCAEVLLPRVFVVCDDVVGCAACFFKDDGLFILLRLGVGLTSCLLLAAVF